MKSLQDVTRRIPPFGDRRAALPPWPPVDLSGPEDSVSARLEGYAAVAAGTLIGLCALMLAVFFCGVQEPAGEWPSTADALRGAVRQYRLDHGAAPPGDGRGSAGLRRALTTPGPRGLPYWMPRIDRVDPAGDLRDPWGRRVLYRPGPDGEAILEVEGDPRR